MQPATRNSPSLPFATSNPLPDRKSEEGGATTTTVLEPATGLRAKAVPSDEGLRERCGDAPDPQPLGQRVVQVGQQQEAQASAPRASADGKHALAKPAGDAWADRLAVTAQLLADKPAHPIVLPRKASPVADDPTIYFVAWYGAAARLGDACISKPKDMPERLSPQAISKAFPLAQRASLLSALHASMADGMEQVEAFKARRHQLDGYKLADWHATELRIGTEQRRMCHMARAFTPEDFMSASQQARSRDLGAAVNAWAENLDWAALSASDRVGQLSSLALGLAESDGLAVGSMRWEPVNTPGAPLTSQASPDAALSINTASDRLGDLSACVDDMLQAHQGRYQYELMRQLQSGELGPTDEAFQMAKVFIAAFPVAQFTPEQMGALTGVTVDESQAWAAALPQAVHARASTQAAMAAWQEADGAATDGADSSGASISASSDSDTDLDSDLIWV